VKPKWKILITIAALVLAGIGIYASTVYANRGLVTVQTARVVRQDLTSLVTASGEIKPKNYINIGANAIGQLTEVAVKEGDHVKKGQLLARIRECPAGGRCPGPAGLAQRRRSRLGSRRSGSQGLR
jgi:HlyD family secretion protein